MTMERVECVLGITSAPESFDVMPFVEEIVTLKLAACVKVFPVGISVFRWKNKLETQQERIILIKTTASCVRTDCRDSPQPSGTLMVRGIQQSKVLDTTLVLTAVKQFSSKSRQTRWTIE